jgi:hypothetical protein
MENEFQHGMGQITRKLDAILAAISILNQSINHLAAAIGADAVKMKESADKLHASIEAAKEIQPFQ